MKYGGGEILNQWKYNRYKILFCALLFLIAGIAVIVYRVRNDKQPSADREIVNKTIESEGKASVSPAPSPAEEITATADPTAGIYTFLQGPKSWGRKIAWSGQWGDSSYDGGRFGAFGCGLCCMANIYSSETKYECSPIDMYRYSKKNTGYGGGGAIAWEYMQQTLERTGFTVSLCAKPGTYAEFQNAIANSGCNIVLVSSVNSECYWKDTPGHYVTIFLYNKESDKIFLADSGDPDHNRHWVSLKKIYKSLKTDSDYQYLSVGAYEQSRDQWKHQGTNGEWVKP